MREIKFRAWDKEEKKWVHDVLIENGGNLGKAGVIGSESHGSVIAVRNYPDKANIIVCLYAELKDAGKDRKEIYEGDTLGHEDSFGKYSASVCFGNLGVGRGWYLDGKGIKKWLDQDLIDAMKMKIIGNIYENPELLQNNDAHTAS